MNMKTLGMMMDRAAQLMFDMFVKEHENIMYEGLVVNERTRTISLTDVNNRGVDFSLENNPIEYRLGDIDVISIFKRTPLKSRGKDKDGNPFIYALKGENGWRFDMPDADIIKYMKRFLQVCKKIKTKYDTIVTVPTKSWINARFMDVIAGQVGAKHKISDYFDKCSIEVAYNSIDDNEIQRVAKMLSPNNTESKIIKIWNRLDRCFGRMERSGSEHFVAKYIHKDLLRFIKNPVSNKTTHTGECAEFFEGKDVLILDDIMAFGSTLSFCAHNIIDTYSPKSITAITLLSKKF